MEKLNMKLHKYPEYKNSDVEWLGEIPGHWEVVSSKALRVATSEALTPSEGFTKKQPNEH